jgi:DNA-binding response OmpR family regulator
MEAQAPGELATLAQRPVRILVVDDNVQEQQLLRMKLEALGVSLIQVRQGRLGIMTAQKTNPDIVILDLGTTDMPGLEVLRHLKTVKRTSSIPVICISNSHDETYRLRALRMNADWYLPKPFRFSEMLARLRYHAQEIAARTVLKEDISLEALRKNILRAAVDTLSDSQDMRKALHGLKGYVGADDYYLNSKLESCFRNLTRIENRLKEFREWTARRPPRPTSATPILLEAGPEGAADTGTLALGDPAAAAGGQPALPGNESLRQDGHPTQPRSLPGAGDLPGDGNLPAGDGGEDGTQGRSAERG